MEVIVSSVVYLHVNIVNKNVLQPFRNHLVHLKMMQLISYQYGTRVSYLLKYCMHVGRSLIMMEYELLLLFEISQGYKFDDHGLQNVGSIWTPDVADSPRRLHQIQLPSSKTYIMVTKLETLLSENKSVKFFNVHCNHLFIQDQCVFKLLYK